MKSHLRLTRNKPPGTEVRLRPLSESDALMDLVRLRVAQIQECQIGIDHYWLRLEAAGETTSRLSRVEIWPLSLVFTLKERTALALAELLIHPLPDEGNLLPHLFQEAQSTLTRAEIIQIVMAVEAMRDWQEGFVHG